MTTHQTRDNVARAVVFGSDAELATACAAFVAAHEKAASSAPTVDSMLPISITHVLDDAFEAPSFDANGSPTDNAEASR